MWQTYTAAELIEMLKTCPQDYTIVIRKDGSAGHMTKLTIAEETKEVYLEEEL